MPREADVIVQVHFKGVEHDRELHELLEKRCQVLAEEFHETDCYEISLSNEANQISAHAKVTGKNTSVAAHADAPEERQAAEAALDRLERELRREHDKRIFAPRREARRERSRR